jgi:hypothetical protein
MVTFIERHGYVQYAEIGQPGQPDYPRVQSCEVCGTESAWLDPPFALSPFYVFDHCHTHGWVRGILCLPCNSRMGFVDRGEPQDARLVAHRLTCPNCAEPGAPPPPPPPKPCKRCRGCGVIWIPCLIRMVRCPDCGGTATHRDIPAWAEGLRTVTISTRPAKVTESHWSRSVTPAGRRTRPKGRPAKPARPARPLNWDNWDILGQASVTGCDGTTGRDPSRSSSVTDCDARSVTRAAYQDPQRSVTATDRNNRR